MNTSNTGFNTARSANRLLTSVMNTTNSAFNTVATNLNSAVNSVNSGSSSRWSWFLWIVLIGIIATLISLAVVYRNAITEWWNINILKQSPAPSSTPPDVPPEHQVEDGTAMASASDLVEKVLPSGKAEVFNVAPNRYTYYDAEPLCRAFGAELATYEQVKEAWGKGADWCNYGWAKGQMAIYPTQKDTYNKLQSGPPEQALACGRVGVNGGYFDNPELRFGVNCFGVKPPKSQHDDASMSAGIPLSPDALEIDKKIQQFKSETGSIGILPFNSNSWD
jgi:Extracellular link domain